MLQASPSGDDSIIGRQASQGPPPSLRTVFSLTGSLCFHQSLPHPRPCKPSKEHVSKPVPENPVVLSPVGTADNLVSGWRQRRSWDPCVNCGSLLCASFEGRRPPENWEGGNKEG